MQFRSLEWIEDLSYFEMCSEVRPCLNRTKASLFKRVIFLLSLLGFRTFIDILLLGIDIFSFFFLFFLVCNSSTFYTNNII